ncbi:hypothetical protein EIN_462280, partial [Entamoeba invadens IP1]
LYRGNSYYKELKYDVVSLQSQGFDERSVVLVEMIDGTKLKKPKVKPQQNEEDDFVEEVMSSLSQNGVIDFE